MSALQTRSELGCLNCRKRRNECDDIRPECNRCKRAGTECLGYSYLDHYVPTPWQPGTSSHVASRTTPQTTESSTSAIPEAYLVNDELNYPLLDIGVPNNDSWYLSSDPWQTCVGLSDITSLNDSPCVSTQIQLGSPTQPTTQDLANFLWGPNLLPHESFPELTNENMDIHAGGYSSADIVYGAPATALVSGTPSLLAYGYTDNQQLTRSQPTTSQCLLSPSNLLVEGTSSSGSASRTPAAIDPREDPFDNDEFDTEGVMGITLSLVLDHTSPDNSLPFTLSAYFRWMMRSMFEPLKAAPSTKDKIVRRYMSSSDSRFGALRVARIMEALMKDPSMTLGNLPELVELEHQTQDRIRLLKSARMPLPESYMSDITAALHIVHELVAVRRVFSSMSYNVTMLRDIAPLYRQACPEPPGTPLNLPAQLMHPENVLRHFPAMDILLSLATGLPMIFRYDLDCVPEASYQHVADVTIIGVQYMHGIPDQFLLMLARIHMLRSDTASGSLEPRIIQELEHKISIFKSVIDDSPNSYLKIARLTVHEAWRQAMYIYLYMGLCGASSDDIRVEKAVKRFVKLLDGVKHARNPDVFLCIPISVVGVAARKRRYRNILSRRILGISDYGRVGSAGDDTVRMLNELYGACDRLGRPSVWDDLRTAWTKVTGII